MHASKRSLLITTIQLTSITFYLNDPKNSCLIGTPLFLAPKPRTSDFTFRSDIFIQLVRSGEHEVFGKVNNKLPLCRMPILCLDHNSPLGCAKRCERQSKFNTGSMKPVKHIAANAKSFVFALNQVFAIHVWNIPDELPKIALKPFKGQSNKPISFLEMDKIAFYSI